MESSILSVFLPLILAALLLILLIKKLGIQKTSYHSNNLPPGPWKLPIIGNMHQLIGEHPHRRLRSLANSYGPLLHLKLGEINLMVITSPELVREIFKTHELNFASSPRLMVSKFILYDNVDFVLVPSGKRWSQLRKICAVELLSLKRVKSFSFIREEEGNNLVEKIRMADGSPVNLSKMLLSVASRSIVRVGFGKGCAHQESFLLAIKKMFKYISQFNFCDVFPSWSFLGEISFLRYGMERAHKKVDAILNEIIEEHEAKNLKEEDMNEDLVDVLLRIKKNEELDPSLTIENVKAVIFILFLSGIDSISVTIVWAMTELIRHPEIMQKVQIEVRKALNGKIRIEEGDINKLPYLNQVIKETLRLHPTSPLLVPKLCRETVELSGYTIPAESWVVINAWAIMRDPKYWEDPESFRPERFGENAIDFGGTNFEYTPFGGGRSTCPGMPFVLANMECWLAKLLFYFDWELPGGRTPQELDVEEAFSLALTRKNDLHLVATYHE